MRDLPGTWVWIAAWSKGSGVADASLASSKVIELSTVLDDV
jgi:hypothetical protein